MSKARTHQLDYCEYHEEWIEDISTRLEGREARLHNVSHVISNRHFVFGLDAGYRRLVEECTELVGGLQFHQLRGVYLPAGNYVQSHQHQSMTVILYMPHDHTCMLGLSEPDELIPTQEGHAVEISRGRYHWVTENLNEPRVTLAVMFSHTQ